MKKKIVVLALILCIASASTVLAQGKPQGKYGGYQNDRLEFAVGVARGLFLGSALMYSVTTPPAQTIIYGAPYIITYQQQVVVQPPVLQQQKICVQDRIVNGQGHFTQNDGSKVWRSSRYPIIQRVQVPCD